MAIYTLKESSIPYNQLTDSTELLFCTKDYNSKCRHRLSSVIAMFTTTAKYQTKTHLVQKFLKYTEILTK